MLYKKEGVPLVILAGTEYGAGSSRDWAAKGTYLLGVRAVLAASFERIHRSNLVGMGVLPLRIARRQHVAIAGPVRRRDVRHPRRGRPVEGGCSIDRPSDGGRQGPRVPRPSASTRRWSWSITATAGSSRRCCGGWPSCRGVGPAVPADGSVLGTRYSVRLNPEPNGGQAHPLRGFRHPVVPLGHAANMGGSTGSSPAVADQRPAIRAAGRGSRRPPRRPSCVQGGKDLGRVGPPQRPGANLVDCGRGRGQLQQFAEADQSAAVRPPTRRPTLVAQPSTREPDAHLRPPPVDPAAAALEPGAWRPGRLGVGPTIPAGIGRQVQQAVQPSQWRALASRGAGGWDIAVRAKEGVECAHHRRTRSGACNLWPGRVSTRNRRRRESDRKFVPIGVCRASRHWNSVSRDWTDWKSVLRSKTLPPAGDFLTQGL